MRAQIEDLKAIHAMIEPTQEKTGASLGGSEKALRDGIETLTTATDIMLNSDDVDALAGATGYLRLCGDIIGGALLIKATCNGLMAGDAGAQNMQKLTWYHALAVMPQAASYLDIIRRGVAPLSDYPESALADL